MGGQGHRKEKTLKGPSESCVQQWKVLLLVGTHAVHKVHSLGGMPSQENLKKISAIK